jgi:cell division septation protein DedD
MAARPYSLSFNLFELFTLLGAVLATSFLVFLCGLYVGKRVQERRSVQAERTVRLPVTIVPGAEEEELSEALVSERTVSERSGRSLRSQQQKESDLSLLTELPKPKTDRLPTRIEPPQTVSPSLQDSGQAVKPAVARPVVAGGRWSVQVEATRDKATASAMARRLRAEGYEVYTVRMERQREAWYRVRVGQFASLAEASSTAARLRREGKATQTFVVSE